MGDSIKLIIPGEPVAQGRPRFTKQGHAYDPPKSAHYKQYIIAVAKAAMRGKQPLSGTLGLSVRIYRSIPASWPKHKKAAALSGEIRPTSKPDTSNYIKGIEDALNGICWEDDSAIVDYLPPFGKWYSAEPRIEVEVVKID